MMLTIGDDAKPWMTRFRDRGTGLVPRDFQAHPPGYLKGVAAAFPSDLLVPPADFPALIDLEKETRSSLVDVMKAQGVPSLDQGREGFCWAYSTSAAVMALHARDNHRVVPLSGHMVGCIIKGYRNQGGWNAQSLKFATEKGIASQAVWPQQSMSRSNETPEMWADARRSRVVEWWDLPNGANAAKHALASLLIRKLPVMIDLNWWSHSIVALRLVSWDPFEIECRNSWGPDYGEDGFFRLKGSKAIPNGAASPRTLVIEG